VRTQGAYQQQRFDTQDCRLNYVAGSTPGNPWLFLHGVTRCWQDLLPLMSGFDREWQVIGLDLRGHALSGRSAGQYLVVDYIRDAVTFVRGVFHKPGIVFGHSLGAMIACAVAAEAPEYVQAVILEDPPFDTLGSLIFETPFHSYFVALQRLLVERSDTAAALASRLAEIRMPAPDGRTLLRLGDVRTRDALQSHAECLIALDPEVLAPLVAGTWLDGFAWESALDKITCPVFLLVGDTACGGMLPGTMADRIEKRLARCTRINWPGVGHHLHMQRPEQVHRCVMRFLESL